jgi:MIP family channel proteins
MQASPATDARPDRRGPEAFAAEFLGTLILVLFVGLVLTGNSQGVLGYADWAVIGLVHLLILALLFHTLGRTSGAHLNPAITVALVALRRMRAADGAVYVVVQLLGALAGALLVKLLLDAEGDPVGYGAPAVSDQFLDGKALAGFLAELIGAFVLMWAYMSALTDRRGTRPGAALLVGGALAASVMALGPLTGGAFNPARAFGPALVGGEFGEAGTWIVAFVLGPLVGALLAATLFGALARTPAATDAP